MDNETLEKLAEHGVALRKNKDGTWVLNETGCGCCEGPEVNGKTLEEAANAFLDKYAGRS